MREEGIRENRRVGDEPSDRVFCKDVCRRCRHTRRRRTNDSAPIHHSVVSSISSLFLDQ